MSSTPSAVVADSNPYRVLIVEDDRSQAMFAEAILRGAGMQAEVVAIPERMMEALERFVPDLVLMDLHMPGTSGTTLTTQIREHTQFSHTPVVFLTGDQDPERELEVLDKGGDDFILKPVRPRHLIAAVQNRIRRARALNDSLQNSGTLDRHPVTGLHTRQALMQALSTQLSHRSPGGALLLELGNPSALRNRYGYAALDGLFNAAGTHLCSLLEPNAIAARLSDNAFLVVVRDVGRGALESFARRLRDGIGYHDFQVDGEPMRLRCTIGYASFEHVFGGGNAFVLR